MRGYIFLELTSRKNHGRSIRVRSDLIEGMCGHSLGADVYTIGASIPYTARESEEQIEKMINAAANSVERPEKQDPTFLDAIRTRDMKLESLNLDKKNNEASIKILSEQIREANAELRLTAEWLERQDSAAAVTIAGRIRARLGDVT